MQTNTGGEMNKYTPTTEEIRGLIESFAKLLNNSPYHVNNNPYQGLGDTVLEQFDRWLAEHDRQVRAGARAAEGHLQRVLEDEHGT